MGRCGPMACDGWDDTETMGETGERNQVKHQVLFASSHWQVTVASGAAAVEREAARTPHPVVTASHSQSQPVVIFWAESELVANYCCQLEICC